MDQAHTLRTLIHTFSGAKKVIAVLEENSNRFAEEFFIRLTLEGFSVSFINYSMALDVIDSHWKPQTQLRLVAITQWSDLEALHSVIDSVVYVHCSKSSVPTALIKRYPQLKVGVVVKNVTNSKDGANEYKKISKYGMDYLGSLPRMGFHLLNLWKGRGVQSLHWRVLVKRFFELLAPTLVFEQNK